MTQFNQCKALLDVIKLVGSTPSRIKKTIDDFVEKGKLTQKEVDESLKEYLLKEIILNYLGWKKLFMCQETGSRVYVEKK